MKGNFDGISCLAKSNGHFRSVILRWKEGVDVCVCVSWRRIHDPERATREREGEWVCRFGALTGNEVHSCPLPAAAAQASLVEVVRQERRMQRRVQRRVGRGMDGRSRQEGRVVSDRRLVVGRGVGQQRRVGVQRGHVGVGRGDQRSRCVDGRVQGRGRHNGAHDACRGCGSVGQAFPRSCSHLVC